MKNNTMCRDYLLFLLLTLAQACSLTSDLDKYDDYRFENKSTGDAGQDGDKPDASETKETFWQRYDRLSAEVSPACAQIAKKHLYCTGGIELEVDLTCPERCHAVTGRHCFCPYKREYSDAMKICQSVDMHLVKIDDKDENELIAGLMIDMGLSSDKETSDIAAADGATWIGLNDLDEEGRFVWPDGSQTTYEPWDFNQPDDLAGPDGEDCVAIRVAEDSRALWYDFPCELYAGIEMEKRHEARNFFFCETKDADKKIGDRSVAFTSDNIDSCQRPTSLVLGETCCTTVSDVANHAAIEPGRCGAAPGSGFGSICSQFCRPGKADYESGCPENIIVAGLSQLAPCCTTLGNDNAGYLCGLFHASSGCIPSDTATITCPKPTAYKGDDEPLYTEWKMCGSKECVLAPLDALAWADQCCTESQDVELLWAVESGQCGLRLSGDESNPCTQLNQKGVPDETCPPFHFYPNSPDAEFASFINPGCCTEYGVCGEIDNIYWGCSIFRNDMENPYQLCRRANKDETIGFDPLFNEISYGYLDDTGRREIRSKDYGDCDDPITYNDNIYYLCQGPLEWNQARAACEWKKDRYLVRIDDEGENDFLREISQNSPFWIGAYMNDKNVLPDDWLWSNADEPFFLGYTYKCGPSGVLTTWEVLDNRYANWVGCDNFHEDEAQPKNDQGIEENCAQMRPDGYWSSEDCARKQAYVCEEKG